jgi:hypothetical protein
MGQRGVSGSYAWLLPAGSILRFGKRVNDLGGYYFGSSLGCGGLSVKISWPATCGTWSESPFHRAAHCTIR